LDPEVVDRGDVAVVEVPGELRLTEETAPDFFVIQRTGLDRDRSLDERIAGLEDGAEAADSDLFRDLVFADLSRGHGRIGGVAKFNRKASLVAAGTVLLR